MLALYWPELFEAGEGALRKGGLVSMAEAHTSSGGFQGLTWELTIQTGGKRDRRSPPLCGESVLSNSEAAFYRLMRIRGHKSVCRDRVRMKTTSLLDGLRHELWRFCSRARTAISWLVWVIFFDENARP